MKKTASEIADSVLTKLSGYRQNIVGFKNPRAIKALLDTYEKSDMDAIHEMASEDTRLKGGTPHAQWLRKFKAEDFGGMPREVAGNPEVAKMQAYGPDFESIRKGQLKAQYIKREQLLAALQKYLPDKPGQTNPLIEKIRASKHPYFSSSIYG